MPKKADSFNEQVARIAISRLTGEAKQVAEQRGLPPEVRFATPAEELALFDEWDDRVDPVAVLNERFQKYTQDGLPPDHAMTEAILDTCAAGFHNRLKMAQGGGRLSLTEQTKYLEDMGTKPRKQQPPPDVGGAIGTDQGAPETAPLSLPTPQAEVTP